MDLLYLRPTSNGDINNANKIGGNIAYALVDDLVDHPDDGTTYLSHHSYETDTDLFHHSPITNESVENGIINKLTLFYRGYGFSLTDGSIANWIRGILKLNGIMKYSNTKSVNTGVFRNYTKEYIVNPYTGLSWTIDDINNLQFGIQLHTEEKGGTACTQVYLIVEYIKNISASNGFFISFLNI